MFPLQLCPSAGSLMMWEMSQFWMAWFGKCHHTDHTGLPAESIPWPKVKQAEALYNWATMRLCWLIFPSSGPEYRKPSYSTQPGQIVMKVSRGSVDVLSPRYLCLTVCLSVCLSICVSHLPTLILCLASSEIWKMTTDKVSTPLFSGKGVVSWVSVDKLILHSWDNENEEQS